MAGFEALPLCLPLSGVLKGRVYTFQWSCMLILLYFAEAVMRLADVSAASRLCAAAAAALSRGLFRRLPVVCAQRAERSRR